MLCTTNIVFGMDTESSKMYTIQIVTTYLEGGQPSIQTVNKDGTLTKPIDIDLKTISTHNKGELTISSQEGDKFNLSCVNTDLSCINTDLSIGITRKQFFTMLKMGRSDQRIDRKFIITNQNNVLCLTATFEKKSLHSYLANEWDAIAKNSPTPNILVEKNKNGKKVHSYIARDNKTTEFKDQSRIKDHNSTIIGNIYYYDTESLNSPNCPLQVIDFSSKEMNDMQKEFDQGNNIYLEYENGEKKFYIGISFINEKIEEKSKFFHFLVTTVGIVFKLLVITVGITGLAFLAVCLMTPGFGTKLLERIISMHLFTNKK
jgi:hypothetical protein